VLRKRRQELKTARCIRCASALTAILLGTANAAAGEVTVRVENLRNGEGSVLVAICAPEAFLSLHCAHRGRTRAREGAVEVTIGGVPAGSYAVQTIHDENDNFELDRTLFGFPREGLAFSHDAPMRMGPPRFADAAVEFGEGGGSVTLHMRYF
jgi:uncharacterized protein (DUF2141 family)